MKGIAHFVAGVAIASFFPEVVVGAARNAAFGPLLGGIAGLLPDTLDFKFFRYFYRLDDAVDPATIMDDAGKPNPQAMAERIAVAVNRAYDTGKEMRLCLHTWRLGADRWRRYTVTLASDHDPIVVQMGPAVSTGQMVYPDSEIPGVEPGRAQPKARIVPTYEPEIQVDIFSGPAMAFRRVGDVVVMDLVPWHRRWTHSLAGALLLAGVGFVIAPVYGLVMGLAALAHMAADQIGFMGSSLLLPVVDRRLRGLGWMHSGDAIPNFLVVWVSLACILLNLDRFSSAPQIPVAPYVLGAIVVPSLLLLGLDGGKKAWARLQPARVAGDHAALAVTEALDETNEVDI